MDRFIVLDLALKSGIDFDLKSSMDRFIAASCSDSLSAKMI